MSVQLTGAPKTLVTVSDQTNLVAAPLGGIICVQGETMRGEKGKAVFIGSSGQFKRELGGLHPSSPFPIYCLRLLDAGVKLWVTPSAHYTDASDKTTITGTKATGTIGSGTPTASFSAKHVGSGYNGTTILVQAPSSFQVGVFDVIVTLPGSDQSQTVRDVKATPTAGELVALNQKLGQVSMVSGTLSLATIILAGGVQDTTAITAADYAGSAISGTGWFAFGPVTDSYRIANLHKPSPLIDASLVAYVTARGDMRAHLGLPLGANALGMEDYRMGTGSYSHSPVDTWLASYVGGSDIGNDGVSLDLDIDIPGIVEALPCIAAKDALDGPWFSASRLPGARVRSFNKGVPYNLASPDLSADFDRLYLRGINAIVQDPVYSTILTGNRSALLDNTKILSKENVADLVLYLIRTFKPVFRKQAFQPDDPQMWKSIYRNALPIIQDLEARRAIVPGEGSGWQWLGDQEANTRADASYNTQDDLAQGKYRAGFIFQPIAATEYLSLSLVAADANSFQFAIQQGQTI